MPPHLQPRAAADTSHEWPEHTRQLWQAAMQKHVGDSCDDLEAMTVPVGVAAYVLICVSPPRSAGRAQPGLGATRWPLAWCRRGAGGACGAGAGRHLWRQPAAGPRPRTPPPPSSLPHAAAQLECRLQRKEVPAANTTEFANLFAERLAEVRANASTYISWAAIPSEAEAMENRGVV